MRPRSSHVDILCNIWFIFMANNAFSEPILHNDKHDSVAEELICFSSSGVNSFTLSCAYLTKGTIQVLRNADGGGGGCMIFGEKALRRCNVQCY